MIKQVKWLSLAISLITALSMGLLSTGVRAAVPAAKHVAKRTAKKNSNRSNRLVGRAAACNHHRDTATGTIKYSDWEFPDNLNPYQTTESVSFETIDAMEDGLFTYNAKAKLVPQMATNIPTAANHEILNGGRTFIVHLKPGLRWSNGTYVTSQDVKFGWQMGMNSISGPYCSGSCDVIARIDTPNTTTVVFHLKHPYAPFLAYGIPPIWPTTWAGAWNGDPAAAAKVLWQTTGFNFEGPNYPTDGAYQVQTFANSDRIVLRPMKYYDDMNCGGYVKNMIFAFYSSKEGMIAAAAAKQTDVTEDYTPADLKSLKTHHTFKTSSVPGFTFEHLEFNLDKTWNGKPNPVANTKVRQALALALDKIGLIQSALGVNRVEAYQLASWGPWINVRGLVQPFADRAIRGQWDPIRRKYVVPGTTAAVADARQLLAATPYKNGFSVQFYTTSGNAVRQAQEAVIAASWHKLGVTAVPNYIPASKLFGTFQEGGTLRHGAFQVAMFAFSGAPDPDGLKYEMQGKYVARRVKVPSPIDDNNSGINNPVINTAFDVAASSINPKVRAREYKAVQVVLAQRDYWIGLFFRPSIATVDNHVVNFSNSPVGGPDWNKYAWRYQS